MLKLKVRCNKHPRYRGKKPPKDCPGCYVIFDIRGTFEYWLDHAQTKRMKGKIS
jgi:hypothetical protein